jgi:hypothetical protein
MFAALQTPPGGQEHIDYTQAAGCEIATTLPEGTGVLPDPLYIGPLDQLVNDALDPEVPGDCCSISPDAGMKANVSGDCYYVELPSFGMDVLFQDGRGKTFVDYLRRVCKWAGFPGWELERNPPIDLIRELTRDLLPL